MFKKDYTTEIRRLLPINSFLEDLLIKVRGATGHSEEVCAFVYFIPGEGQQQCKEFVDARPIRCKNLVADTITKDNLVTPGKSTAKVDPKKTSALKESHLNKLRATTLFRPFFVPKYLKYK